MVPASIENPTIQIGDKKIVFHVKMESGMYLEFNSITDCKLYGSKGEFIKDVMSIGQIPSITPGNNLISMTCNNSQISSSRLMVTVISEGQPLQKKF